MFLWRIKLLSTVHESFVKFSNFQAMLILLFLFFTITLRMVNLFIMYTEEFNKSMSMSSSNKANNHWSIIKINWTKSLSNLQNDIRNNRFKMGQGELFFFIHNHCTLPMQSTASDEQKKIATCLYMHWVSSTCIPVV